jgi:leucyl-tRNA synthetase
LAAKRIGFSIDWRREFNTIMPTYQKFIEWQYSHLKEKG